MDIDYGTIAGVAVGIIGLVAAYVKNRNLQQVLTILKDGISSTSVYDKVTDPSSPGGSDLTVDEKVEFSDSVIPVYKNIQELFGSFKR